MDRGVIAAAVVPHVPTLGLAQNTPEFQLTLVEGERALGRALRELKPDLFVVNSAHWICTFGWYATCQSVHQGVCVADEAPDLIPGIAYRRKGDSEFASALIGEWQAQGLPGGRNDTPHYCLGLRQPGAAAASGSGRGGACGSHADGNPRRSCRVHEGGTCSACGGKAPGEARRVACEFRLQS